MANALITGFIITVLASKAFDMPSAWEDDANVVLGLWLVVSPWVLGFDDNLAARVNAVCAGTLVALFEAWVVLREQGLFDASGWRRRHRRQRHAG